VVAAGKPRSARPRPPLLDKDNDYDNDSGDYNPPGSNQNPTPTPVPVALGYYSCSALESLWESEGGSSGTAYVAAEVAMAESGGDPNAISPTDDYGLWQINRPSWGSQASLDPVVNARAAIAISGDGTDWTPWTTFTSGAYAGRC
jgi:hypothetical protein